MHELQKRGIASSNYFQPIHLQPFYKNKFGFTKGSFPITEEIASRTLALPFYSNLTEKEIDVVVKSLKEVLHG